jgi:hypothetical protein
MSVTDQYVSGKLAKEWTSPIYAFFQPMPDIGYEDGRRYHSFKCTGKSCTKTIRRYLDKKDAKSTGNLRKHAKSCWGEAAVQAVDQAKNATEARDKIVTGILRDGSITAAFERHQKGKVTYSHRQHTKTEARYETACCVRIIIHGL